MDPRARARVRARALVGVGVLGLYRLALVLALLALVLALALAVALASILYSGMLATCLGVAPYAGIKFGSYEAIKGALGQVASVEEKDLVPWQRVTAGAIAGLIAQTVVYPLDVVRRRMQVRVRVTPQTHAG